jgi:1-acyl-sn-glycerol-3-phosphate acyltransferase
MVIASNHLSAIDPTLVGSYCPRTIFNMAKVELLAIPIAGEVLQWTGAFPVRRGEGDRDALRYARELVRRGHAVGIFLEGHRQPFGYPGPALPGGLMIAMQESVPVIPVGLYSFGWSLRNRMRCVVVYGEPMRFDDVPCSGKGYKQAAEIVGAEVLRLWRMACEAIAAGCPAELPDGARRTGKYPDFKRSGPR